MQSDHTTAGVTKITHDVLAPGKTEHNSLTRLIFESCGNHASID